MKYKKGEIVLAQFPFTDGTGTKLRPVLILTISSVRHSDYLVMFISSQVSQKDDDDIILDSLNPDYKNSGLNKTSVLKLLKLGTISESMVLGTIGELSTATLEHVIDSIIKKLRS